MKLEQSFVVGAPVEQVWDALIDVERIAPCLPGAQISGRDDSGAYAGTFTVKLGPTTASYRGSLKLESLDAEGHMATMSARGSDKRGQGGASATIVSTLHAEDGATRVEVDTDFTITGRLARFGRGGMVEDISRRLLREFATCLQATLGESPGPRAASAPAAEAAEAAEAAAAPPAVSGEGPRSAGPLPPSTATATAAARPAARTKPPSGISLLLGALWDRLRRLLSRARSD